jgi:hypothetical protein
MRLVLIGLLGWGSVMLMSIKHTSGNDKSDAQDEVRREFMTRIAKYVAIQKKAMSGVPSLPRGGVTNVNLIIGREQKLAEAVRTLRPNAKLGDVFTPRVIQMFTSTIKAQVATENGDALKETILGEGNPQSSEESLEKPQAIVHVGVNATYPPEAPLSTMPASLLFALPELPESLEYRFVGHTLILRDREANLIVDAVFNAI